MLKSIIKACSSNIYNETAFRITYFVSLLFSGVVFLDILSVPLCAATLIWSALILIHKIKLGTFNVKYSKIVMLFLLFSMITAVINITVGFPINVLAEIVIIYHAAICFFLFYGMPCDIADFDEIKKEIILACKVLVVISTSLVLLSFILLIFKDSFTFSLPLPPIIEKYGRYIRVVGIIKGEESVRFTGVFINPNILAFCSTVSIIFCHILYRTDQIFNLKRKWSKVLLVTLIVSAHFLALVLSDSIASFLFLVIYAVLWMFYKMILENKISSIKLIAKHSAFFLMGCFILVLGLFGFRACFQNNASDIIDNVYSIITNYTSSPDINNDIIHFGRPNYDIRDGSGRSRLLAQGFYIFLKHPLFGIGSTNVIEYGNVYFESGIAFSNFHNGYFSILVCNGVAGFITFVAFLSLVMLNLLMFFFKKYTQLKATIFVNLLICILAYLVFALFEKALLSEINFMSIFFWLVLGYAMTFFMKYNYKKE